ncbi:MAG: hypothetical protein RLZZ182_1686 [Pseudomonadota bacterium]|jgi:MSHA biogenesis protein MshJ
MKKMDLAALQDLEDQARRRWRQWRRQHAARTLSERRLLVIAGAAVCWYLLDLTMFTPAWTRFKAAQMRATTAESAIRARDAEVARQGQDLALMEGQLKGELERLRVSVGQQKKALAELQSGLVPARDMRQVIEGLLARNGNLSLLSMKTLSPEDITKAGLTPQDASGLYRQGLEVIVTGGFNDLLAWLVSAEQMPRKLLWQGLVLQTDEAGRLILNVRLLTVSPDAEPLEISAP